MALKTLQRDIAAVGDWTDNTAWAPSHPINVSTTITAAINASVGALTVASAAGLPVAYPYYLFIGTEVVQVTAAVGTTLTVTRGALASTPAVHLINAAIVFADDINDGGFNLSNNYWPSTPLFVGTYTANGIYMFNSSPSLTNMTIGLLVTNTTSGQHIGNLNATAVYTASLLGGHAQLYTSLTIPMVLVDLDCYYSGNAAVCYCNGVGSSATGQIGDLHLVGDGSYSAACIVTGTLYGDGFNIGGCQGGVYSHIVCVNGTLLMSDIGSSPLDITGCLFEVSGSLAIVQDPFGYGQGVTASGVTFVRKSPASQIFTNVAGLVVPPPGSGTRIGPFGFA